MPYRIYNKTTSSYVKIRKDEIFETNSLEKAEKELKILEELLKAFDITEELDIEYV